MRRRLLAFVGGGLVGVWSFVYLALRHAFELILLGFRSAKARRSRSWYYATSWWCCAASIHGPACSPPTVRCSRR
jgi:hypothetical protein